MKMPILMLMALFMFMVGLLINKLMDGNTVLLMERDEDHLPRLLEQRSPCFLPSHS
jgi:hypothetical protein